MTSVINGEKIIFDVNSPLKGSKFGKIKVKNHS